MGEWESGRAGEWEMGRRGEGEKGRRGESPILPTLPLSHSFCLQRPECVKLTLPDTADTLRVREPLPTRPCAERPGP